MVAFPPMWKLNSSGTANCGCVYVKMFDACKLLYEPILARIDQVDVLSACPDHQIEAETATHGLWTPNGHFYGTRALHDQQRTWIQWRVRYRVRLEVEYARLRDQGHSPEGSYSAVVPNDIHPAMVEQVPPQRMEAEYQSQLLSHVVSGTEAPWARSLPVGPDAEPVMPEKIAPPVPLAISERGSHWQWINREEAIREAYQSLVSREINPGPDDDLWRLVTLNWSGKRVRTAQLDTKGNLSTGQRDRVRSALSIQFGSGVATVD